MVQGVGTGGWYEWYREMVQGGVVRVQGGGTGMVQCPGTIRKHTVEKNTVHYESPIARNGCKRVGSAAKSLSKPRRSLGSHSDCHPPVTKT